ncbi:elongation of very long chain fatty acids protein-like [Leptopilina boulardi]|uniref:elongation of very long chain fatty acids protein-like n=1 Tax=Leptopilina boulardi TaxID=63433 RepID=UPI0021F5C351|nr:elongation of very long chain fatty acids protein-like [Leptopilina boulardi]
MATIVRAVVQGYRYLNDEVSDPRTQDWFLMRTPWPGLALLGFYLHFVFNVGPRFMANKTPYQLDRIMQIYNVVQVTLSSFLFYKALALAWLWDYKFACEPVDFSNDPKALEIAGTVWLYFIVKIIDLFDTVFFVLRKKYNQISFLHVYHHTGMVIGAWGAVKYLPGGHITFLGLINSFVHIVMYSHYLATSLKLGKPWWKKYITQLQLVQFVFILFHFAQLAWVKNCAFPRWPAAIMVPQNLFMIVLFGDFYYKTYIKKRIAKNAGQNGFSKHLSNGKSKHQ